MAFAEDISLFFDKTDGFAVSATFKAAAIDVIFDNEYYAVPGEEVDVESSQPAAHCKSSDVASAVIGDALTINDGDHAGDYTIINVRPDGTGVTILALEEQ
ncbi:hypothetical protein [Prosthecochloris sp.]|uniref:head-tail joining protein n=1 Tax=Prosthecochloris sp. TaxID=290513 RepID=UPI0025E301E3|nr:hypothetical protein [Prosthecochloris sp.]